MWRSEVAVLVVRRCFSHGCLVFLVVTPVASACVDSAGFVGVVFGLTRVVVEAFTMFPLLCSGQLSIRVRVCVLRAWLLFSLVLRLGSSSTYASVWVCREG
ncbi:hypothetical protein Taro_006770 [Colocasia esculenta]|uniref:Uncharacterized protein n=1 Tax=Colocasia esculenta TaxID=4460 RepID=A0A843TYL4_COLES|nr:hypothetical protein [Colocasia esculenta]